MKLCVRFLPCLPFASLFCPHILRIAPHPVFLSIIGKSHLHIGPGVRPGIFTPQHSGFAAVPAGIAVKCKCNGVKQSGLPRAGVTRNKIKPPVSQRGHIQGNLTCIWSKCGYYQFCRPHLLPSHISSISFPAKSACCPVMGWLF